MKINPVKKYSGILPAAAALLSSVVTGCDRQNVVGSVPNLHPDNAPRRLPGEAPEHPTLPKPETPAKTPEATEPEEVPQLLGGDVPAENLNLD